MMAQFNNSHRAHYFYDPRLGIPELPAYDCCLIIGFA
jgi:hypothetical protein